MALGELIYAYDTLNQGRIKINNFYSGTSAIWSSSTGVYSVIRNNAYGNLGNQALGFSSMAAGINNTASNTHSIALWGSGNTASGILSFVGGNQNSATTTGAIVVGGQQNKASGTNSSIIGGKQNFATAIYSFVGGGLQNSATTSYSSIIGGKQNTASGTLSSVHGGILNISLGQSAFIGGGQQNSAVTNYSAIIGGRKNGILDLAKHGFIGGGYKNSATTAYASIVGGHHNTVFNDGGTTSDNATIIGGSYNKIGGYSISSAIVGGSGNTLGHPHAYAHYSFMGGGRNNKINARHSATIGSRGCTVSHAYSVALGGGSQTRGSFSLVIGATTTDTANVANNRIRLDATAGQGIASVSWITGTADFAEFFEWLDKNTNNENRFGYFVSLVDDKVEIGNSNVIGIVSAAPGFIGDAAELTWSDMFLKDEWGREIILNYKKYTWNQDGKILSIFVNESGEKFSEHPGPSFPNGVKFDEEIPVDALVEDYTSSKLNPNYDPKKEYIPRAQRKEWAAIGLLGKISVRTAEPITGKSIDVNAQGLAINGTKYNVLSTIREHSDSQYGIVRVFFK